MYWKYLKYLLRHKYYVALELLNYGLWWRALIHDISKFNLAEFIPYAKQWYGNGAQGISYQRAWLHHIVHNPHHWNHWTFVDEDGRSTLPMPYKDVIEMLCDWRAMDKARGKSEKDTIEWYTEHRDDMTLHASTTAIINREFGIKRKKHESPISVISLDESTTLELDYSIPKHLTDNGE
jgi:hypothetical protein